MTAFDRTISLAMDETLALLDCAVTPGIRALLIARRAMLERAAFDYKPTPEQRPDPETWDVIRRATLGRYLHRCGLCMQNGQRIDVHHIIAVQDGGRTVPENLIALCDDCHARIHPWIDVAA